MELCACSISGLCLTEVSQLGLLSPALRCCAGSADTSSAAALGSAARLMANNVLQQVPCKEFRSTFNQATMHRI